MSGTRRYRVQFVMHEPSEDTGDMYLAEAVDLPGCRAWGETPDEARKYLESVAAVFVGLYLERGDAPPGGVAAVETDELVVMV